MTEKEWWVLFLIILSLIFGIYLLSTFAQTLVKIEPDASPEILEQFYFQENTLMSNVPPTYWEPLVYETLIGCLIWYESKGDPNAVGDHGTSFGILQFKPATFQEYCVERYGFTDDIFDSLTQTRCADKMIQDGYVHLWSTYKFCVEYEN